jgi:hypothetical protein
MTLFGITMSYPNGETHFLTAGSQGLVARFSAPEAAETLARCEMNPSNNHLTFAVVPL